MKSKKELKTRYKEMKPEMGVFQIRNTSNDKIFVLGHANMHACWNRHRTQLRFGGHRNTLLQKDWNEIGESSFVFEVISKLKYEVDKTDYIQDIKTLTEMVIEEVKPYGDKGYNKEKGRK